MKLTENKYGQRNKAAKMAAKTTKKQTKLQNEAVYRMQSELCAALANPVRLKILDLIAENGELTSSQILETLTIPKANLSQHLTVLRDAGIIQSRKQGLYQIMSLALPRIKDACMIIKGVLAEKIAREEKLHADLRRELKSGR